MKERVRSYLVAIRQEVLELLKKFKDLLPDGHKVGPNTLLHVDTNESALSDHLSFVAAWCSEIVVGGGARQFSLDEIFVRLTLQKGRVRATGRPRTASKDLICQ